MRLVLILLALLAALPLPAEAQSRRGITLIRGPTASRSVAALEAARRFLCPNGGMPQGRGRCAPGRGYAGGGGTGMLGDDPEVINWDRGIAAPNRAQAPCPPGTVPSRAIAQPNVTRCIAG